MRTLHLGTNADRSDPDRYYAWCDPWTARCIMVVLGDEFPSSVKGRILQPNDKQELGLNEQWCPKCSAMYEKQGRKLPGPPIPCTVDEGMCS